ncbi:DUF3892 domain-containing protein [Sorangium sp. So ce726]|uniref:DUF3892 domain-containing protein n=1 Tax=Sorangium sp. So ce726 TaxID=3133319 RepID=UPI003F60A9F8
MSTGPESPPPEYLIICTEGSPISHLGVVDAEQVITGYSAQLRKTWLRQDVLDAIERGVIFYTAYRKPDGKGAEKLLMGELVRGVPTVGAQYLRTDGNSRLEDNLGNLPACS